MMARTQPRPAQLRPARLHPADLVRLGGTGLRSRPLRVFLSALGIAIGVAAMVAIFGISVSSKAEVNRRLDQLGTNLLRVAPGETLQGTPSLLPVDATRMVSRIGPVEAVAATGAVPANVYRSEYVPVGRTGSIAVLAAEPGLLTTVRATVHSGSWFNPATERFPAVVLGATAARRLDVQVTGTRLWLGGTWFALAGILDPVPLAPELDNAALVGWAAAASHLGFDGRPAMIYVRAAQSQVGAVRGVLGTTANPQRPGEVQVSRPSDALAARYATDSALTGLLLGVGGVALLVGGIGIGNTMVISVLERRSEIGLRRSLGATRTQIRGQFVAESLLMSALGGAGGTVLGVVITAGYAGSRGWPVVVPLWVSAAGVVATLFIGGAAGLYPAVRASRLSPAEALATP